jgi:hypothetical protein
VPAPPGRRWCADVVLPPVKNVRRGFGAGRREEGGAGVGTGRWEEGGAGVRAGRQEEGGVGVGDGRREETGKFTCRRRWVFSRRVGSEVCRWFGPPCIRGFENKYSRTPLNS